MSVEFTFDLSKVADVSDEIIIGISDNYNKIYGSDMSLEKTVVVADEADLSEITFVMNNFAIGHKYSVTVSYLKDENRYALLNFDSQWVTPESTFENSFLTVALGTESVGPFKVVK